MPQLLAQSAGDDISGSSAQETLRDIQHVTGIEVARVLVLVRLWG